MKQFLWAYGVTTVPQRLDDLLPRTLASLARGGFDKPVLFVDGVKRYNRYIEFGLDLVTRDPAVRTAGNWILSVAELYLHQPNAHRYAIFQDDMVCYPNLRQYLEQSPCPDKGYQNLYTFPRNQKLAPSENYVGWYPSNQRGLGAVATVYTREAVLVLLGQKYLWDRAQNCNRGHRSIDGGIVSAMKKAGWEEYVHNPSLVEHTGELSSMKNVMRQKSPSFRGEDFDAMELLPCLSS